jgi:hypothetical protein
MKSRKDSDDDRGSVLQGGSNMVATCDLLFAVYRTLVKYGSGEMSLESVLPIVDVILRRYNIILCLRVFLLASKVLFE